MRLTFLRTTILVAGLAEVARSIRTVENSPCVQKCGNVTDTASDDIVCTEADYGTPTGQRFAKCITCQLGSNTTDLKTGDSDLKWLLYNLRFAMSTCLWGYPDDTLVQSTPCITYRACGPFETNILYDHLSPNHSTYAYCTNMGGEEERGRCSACLHQLGSDHFISNFFTTVTAACDNPFGNTIHLDGSLFENAYVNITAAPQGPSSSVEEDEGPINLGTKIGIAVGAIVVLLAAIGITIVCRGKRRRRHIFEQRQRRTEENNYTNFSRTSIIQAPGVDTKWTAASTTMEESPYSATATERKISPYSSQYTSPASAHGEPPLKPWEWPLSPVTVPGQAVTSPTIGHFPDEKNRDQYEMDRIMLSKKEQSSHDLRLAEQRAKEAASRGFTVAPSVKPVPDVMHFPAPPKRELRQKGKGKK